MPALSTKVREMSLRPEAELLLCCARTRMDTERVERIRVLLQAGIDWAYLLWTARRHRLASLLYWNLSRICPEAVPQLILNRLQHYFHANAWRNHCLTEELLTLLHLLEGHGISAIPYKGPVLAASVYGDLALRRFSDLDILVPKQDVLHARDLLLSQGYQPQVPMTGAQEAAHLHFRYNFKLVRHDIGLLVELHWDITSRIGACPIDFVHLWQRTQPVALAGSTVAHFHPEDLLLLLCVHGAKDAWQRLAWICDIAELLRGSQEIQWPRVIEQAQKLGSMRRLWLGLSLVHQLLGVVLPKHVMRCLQADPVLPRLVAQVCAWLFQEDDNPIGVVDGYAFSLRVRERMQHRIRYGQHLVRLSLTWPGKDHELPPLPASFSWLYYLLRPLRLTRKYGVQVVTRYTHNAARRIVCRAHPRTLSIHRAVHEGGSLLQEADLKSLTLRNTDLSYADLYGAHLAFATLTDANLEGAILTNADLAWADLEHATLINANLTEANLEGAILTHANLVKANLRHASLGEAKLPAVSLLKGADLTGASLRSTCVPTEDWLDQLRVEASIKGFAPEEYRIVRMEDCQGYSHLVLHHSEFDG